MARNNNPFESVAVAVDEENGVNNRKNPRKNAGPKSSYLRYLILAPTIFSYLITIMILGCVIWLICIGQSDCENHLKLPRLQIAMITGLIIVCLINLGTIHLRNKFPVFGLILVMILVMVMFIEGLWLLGTFKTQSRMFPGSPSWLKAKISIEYNWNNIKSCVYDTRTCDDLFKRSYMMKGYDFNKQKLSVIENGCCRPPKHCDMEFVNVTYWKRNDYDFNMRTTAYDVNCDLWRNGETMLCYNCYLCKDGFFKTIQGKWWRLGGFLVVMAVLLTISHLCLFVGTMWERHHTH